VVKTLVQVGKVRATNSARLGASALGMELAEMLAVLMALTPSDFYKSMTTHAQGLARRVPSVHGRRRRVSEVDGH